VLEVLQDFKSAALPLEWLLQVAPRLQPRLFSIASSQKAHPRAAHITAAVVSWRTPFKRLRRVRVPTLGDVRIPDNAD
jgi:sulfite reductase alpha subunit-like flavoprotein